MEFCEVPETDIPEILLFKNSLTDVRLLMDLYYDYLFRKSFLTGNQICYPDNYTIVRAVEAHFLPTSELKAVIGNCAFYSTQSRSINILSHLHVWLEWRQKYIIDLIPLDGKPGLSVPQAVFPSKHRTRFISSPGIYAKDCSLETKKEIDLKIENLLQIFDEIMSKVPT